MKNDSPQIHFELFRYQLLPITQHIQDDLFRTIPSIDELKKRKNEIFDQMLSDFPSLKHRKIPLNVRVDLHKSPWFVVEINTQKNLHRERKDFKKEKIDTWPHVIVIINNDPNVQLIAISRNNRAFRSGAVVTKILKDNFQRFLHGHYLNIHIEALFEEKNFWTLIERFEGRISSVEFELISPNMANISKALTLDLCKLNSDTNSHRTDLKLNSGEGSVLEINRDNELINGLVAYSSDGGGDIKFSIKGMKRTISTSKSTREVSIDELEAKNLTPEALERILKLL